MEEWCEFEEDSKLKQMDTVEQQAFLPYFCLDAQELLVCVFLKSLYSKEKR